MVKKSKSIGWQNLAIGLCIVLMAIVSALMAKVWSDVNQIDVMKHEIESLQNNKGWMKSMQKEIKELQKAVWKSHPGD